MLNKIIKPQTVKVSIADEETALVKTSLKSTSLFFEGSFFVGIAVEGRNLIRNATVNDERMWER